MLKLGSWLAGVVERLEHWKIVQVQAVGSDGMMWEEWGEPVVERQSGEQIQEGGKRPQAGEAR